MSTVAAEPDFGMRFPRWMEWWFAARWRGLFTWVGFAAMAAAIFETGMARWVHDSMDSILQWMARYTPFQLSSSVSEITRISHAFFLLTWFQPLVLRLNLRRSFLWIAIALVLGILLLVVSRHFGGSRFRLVEALAFGNLLGIPGLAVIGYRNRPGMSLVGAALATTFVLLCGAYPRRMEWLILVGASSVYGAVMLFGTNPVSAGKLPRSGNRE